MGPQAAFAIAMTEDDFPSELPPDLLEDLELAAEITDRLEDEGRRLHFEVDPGTGRLAVEVHDDQGNLVRRIAASEALDIALGSSPPDADR